MADGFRSKDRQEQTRQNNIEQQHCPIIEKTAGNVASVAGYGHIRYTGFEAVQYFDEDESEENENANDETPRRSSRTPSTITRQMMAT